MRTLIDSHVLVWALLSPERLSATAERVLGDPSTVILVSYASAWELSIKARRLRLDPVGRFLEKGMRELAAMWLPIEIRHIAVVPDLPPVHRDPFDRMLAAQAICEQLPLITSDATLARYPIPVIW